MSQSQDIPTPVMEVVDGVQRYPRTGIKVVIAGGGLGGLMAALECWRKGNDVQVLERTSSFSTLGDFFSALPNSLSSFPYYPTMHAEYQKDHLNVILKLLTHKGQLIGERDPPWTGQLDKTPVPDTKVSFFNTRAFFGRMLLDQCARLGIKVNFGKRVVKYTENEYAGEAAAETDDGFRYTGDVVIASDGVGTKSHAIIPGADPKLIPTGRAVARVAFDRSEIKPGSKAEKILPKYGDRPEFHIYLGKAMHNIVCLSDEKVGFVLMHVDTNNTSAESWTNFVHPEEIIKTVNGIDEWDENVVDFIRQTPNKVVDWQINWRTPQPIWTSKGGRVIQIGDAAHTFLPSSGNGACSALEDAVSIAECIRLGGKENVPWSTRIHQRLRYERCSVLQRTGFANANALDRSSVAGKGPESVAVAVDNGRWVWVHNAEKYATEKYAECHAHLRSGAPFKNTNLPPGFVYKHWTMEEELEREAMGLPSEMRDTGDWS